MAKVMVIYHSGYGHTQKQAEAVYTGVGSVAGIEAELVAISAEGDLPEGSWEKLEGADAIVLGSPTYMGGPS